MTASTFAGSVGTPETWLVFNGLVVFLLALDLFVFRRESRETTLREAAWWSAFWVGLSLAFNTWIYFHFGPAKGMEFFAGYLLEKSLSVDNLFVFILLFSQFKVPKKDQHRALYWGVIGALVLRVSFILGGTALINRFSWLMYIFGAFLVFTGVKLLFTKEEEDGEPDLSQNRVLKLVRKLVPMTEQYDGAKLFTRQNGKLMATPMLAVLAVVETSDLMFALDSIPAVFGVTTDPFIVYTSNICAILGLRALYFLVAGVLAMFRYLKVGLAVLLAFIGIKMLIANFFHIPIGASLGVIALILGVTFGASIWADKRGAKVEAAVEGKAEEP
ncbi:MAG: TerC family protein [Deltaproteobacteria bacterium]|nr:TerC family protein [Deltaproteobacteria bacterium]